MIYEQEGVGTTMYSSLFELGGFMLAASVRLVLFTLLNAKC